jgi:hypothetical protein
MNQNVRYRVIEYLDIDTRVRVGIVPRKLDVTQFEWMFPRPPYVYHMGTHKLFVFERMEYGYGYSIASPVSMHEISEDTFGNEATIFNLYCREFLLHMFRSSGYILHVKRIPWMTNLKVKVIEDE